MRTGSPAWNNNNWSTVCTREAQPGFAKFETKTFTSPKQLELSNWPPFKRLSLDNILLLYVDEERTSSFSALYLNTPVHKICWSPHHRFFMYTKREVQFIQLLTFLCTSVPNGKIVISCPTASCPPLRFSFMADGTCTLTADPALLSSSPPLLWTSASTVCHHPIHHQYHRKLPTNVITN